MPPAVEEQRLERMSMGGDHKGTAIIPVGSVSRGDNASRASAARSIPWDLVTMPAKSYRAMSVSDLAVVLAEEPSEVDRRRLVLEFVEEYRWESVDDRGRILSERPPPTGDERYDALLAALAEHLAYHDNLDIPEWVYDDDRFLEC